LQQPFGGSQFVRSGLIGVKVAMAPAQL
jgi:hypothetical protein